MCGCEPEDPRRCRNRGDRVACVCDCHDAWEDEQIRNERARPSPPAPPRSEQETAIKLHQRPDGSWFMPTGFDHVSADCHSCETFVPEQSARDAAKKERENAYEDAAQIALEDAHEQPCHCSFVSCTTARETADRIRGRKA